MRQISISFLTFIALLFAGHIGHTQAISDNIRAYAGKNAEGYLQPIGDLLSTVMTTGLWNGMPADSGFHIRVGLTASAVIPFEKQRTFIGETEAPFTPQMTAEVPTIIGPVESVIVRGDNETGYVFPGGFNAKYLPFAAPEISIGSFFGTTVHGKYLGFDPGSDQVGSFTHWGIGFQHNVANYLPMGKWKAGFGYYYQKILLGEEIDGRYHNISLIGGKEGKAGSFYVEAGYQPGTTDLNYTYEKDDAEELINVSLKNEYPFKAEVGGELKLWILRLRAAVRVSPPFGAAAGLNFAFGK